MSDKHKELWQECEDVLISVLMGNYLVPFIFDCFRKDTRWFDFKWRLEKSESIIEAVTPDESGFAYCPLCKHGVAFNGELRGFAYPEGLRRHLLGESNARECIVVEYLKKRSRYDDELSKDVLN